MPAVTEWSRPNGEPIAIAHCPGLSASELPMRSAGRPLASILSRATSDCSSLPTTLALNSRPSDSLTLTSLAPSTTWWLVSTSPSEEMMKPLPIDSPRGRAPRSGMSGNGKPSGPKKRRKISGMSCCCAARERGEEPPPISADTLTTPGPTCSTSCEKSGNPATGVGAEDTVDCCAVAVAAGRTTAVVAAAVRATRTAAGNGAFIGKAPSSFWQWNGDGTPRARAAHRRWAARSARPAGARLRLPGRQFLQFDAGFERVERMLFRRRAAIAGGERVLRREPGQDRPRPGTRLHRLDGEQVGGGLGRRVGGAAPGDQDGRLHA